MSISPKVSASTSLSIRKPKADYLVVEYSHALGACCMNRIAQGQQSSTLLGGEIALQARRSVTVCELRPVDDM